MDVTPVPADARASLAGGRLLRPEQAAYELSVKVSWIYDAVRSGRLPCIRVGRHIRFTREMLETWLSEQPGS
jgi:excisionase family DNA binding protein